MSNCTTDKLNFSQLKRRTVKVDFDGGAVSSDGGVLLLRELDRRLGLLDAAAGMLADGCHAQAELHRHKSSAAELVLDFDALTIPCQRPAHPGAPEGTRS